MNKIHRWCGSLREARMRYFAADSDVVEITTAILSSATKMEPKLLGWFKTSFPSFFRSIATACTHLEVRTARQRPQLVPTPQKLREAQEETLKQMRIHRMRAPSLDGSGKREISGEGGLNFDSVDKDEGDDDDTIVELGGCGLDKFASNEEENEDPTSASSVIRRSSNSVLMKKIGQDGGGFDPSDIVDDEIDGEAVLNHMLVPLRQELPNGHDGNTVRADRPALHVAAADGDRPRPEKMGLYDPSSALSPFFLKPANRTLTPSISRRASSKRDIDREVSISLMDSSQLDSIRVASRATIADAGIHDGGDGNPADDGFDIASYEFKTEFLNAGVMLAAKNFELKRTLGEGAYGKTYSAMDQRNSNMCVVKKVKCGSVQQVNRALSEAAVLSYFRSQRGIVRFEELFIEISDPAAKKGHIFSDVNNTGLDLHLLDKMDDLEAFLGIHVCIVMEFCAGGDLLLELKHARANSRRFSLDIILKWFLQILQGLAAMHEARVIHRDIKPANIFLTEKGDIRIGDLGVSRTLHEEGRDAHTFIGTPAYMAPEVTDRSPYNSSADIWSLGCLIYELVTLHTPGFQMQSREEVMDHIEQDKYGSGLKKIISSMLQRVPGMRPTAKQLIERVRAVVDADPALDLSIVDSSPVVARQRQFRRSGRSDLMQSPQHDHTLRTKRHNSRSPARDRPLSSSLDKQFSNAISSGATSTIEVKDGVGRIRNHSILSNLSDESQKRRKGLHEYAVPEDRTSESIEKYEDLLRFSPALPPPLHILDHITDALDSESDNSRPTSSRRPARDLDIPEGVDENEQGESSEGGGSSKPRKSSRRKKQVGPAAVAYADASDSAAGPSRGKIKSRSDESRSGAIATNAIAENKNGEEDNREEMKKKKKLKKKSNMGEPSSESESGSSMPSRIGHVGVVGSSRRVQKKIKSRVDSGLRSRNLKLKPTSRVVSTTDTSDTDNGYRRDVRRTWKYTSRGTRSDVSSAVTSDSSDCSDMQIVSGRVGRKKSARSLSPATDSATVMAKPKTRKTKAKKIIRVRPSVVSGGRSGRKGDLTPGSASASSSSRLSHRRLSRSWGASDFQPKPTSRGRLPFSGASSALQRAVSGVRSNSKGKTAKKTKSKSPSARPSTSPSLSLKPSTAGSAEQPRLSPSSASAGSSGSRAENRPSAVNTTSRKALPPSTSDQVKDGERTPLRRKN